MKNKAPLAVYIHIPFCVRKCAYCDFLSFSAAEEHKARYIAKLKWEIKESAALYSAYTVRTVFFGG